MRWTLKSKPQPETVKALQQALDIDANIATLLVQRGIETFDDAKAFFRPSLDDLHDPFLMKDMDKAVVRIEKAITNRENILVYGDYDVDGTTSVALMSSYLKTKAENIATYIPDRYKEGYGISFAGIDFADGEVSFEDQGRARVMGINKGLLRVYAEHDTGRFLGAEMIGPSAEHLAHLLAWTIQTGMTVEQILRMPFYHPVLEEGVRTAFRNVNHALGFGPNPPMRCIDCGPGA